MSKVKIKIVLLGYLPYSIDFDKIKNWESVVFEIIPPINTFAFSGNADGDNWDFLDSKIEEQLPSRDGADILLAFTNVPIQHKYYFRRYSDNRACLTYSQMTEILNSYNIPLENLLLRTLYSVSFIYKRYGGKIPTTAEHTNYAHDETRGCIFDMNGIKTNIIYSLNKPQLCHSCIETLTNIPKFKIEREIIEKVQSELKRIKKGVYYQITDFVKTKPVLSIILTSVIAVILGIISSTIGSIIFEKLFK